MQKSSRFCLLNGYHTSLMDKPKEFDSETLLLFKQSQCLLHEMHISDYTTCTSHTV